MDFDAWWNSLTTEEQNRMDRNGAMAAWEFGQLEAAQTILKMWYAPWGVTQMPFIDSLEAYVEELKAEAGRETQFLIASSGAERPARLPGILGGSGSGAN